MSHNCLDLQVNRKLDIPAFLAPDIEHWIHTQKQINIDKFAESFLQPSEVYLLYWQQYKTTLI